MINQRVKWLLAGLFVLWVFFTLGSFFTVQKPFTTGSPQLVVDALLNLPSLSAADGLAIGSVLLDLLTAGWLVLVALKIGTCFLQWLLPGACSPLESLVLGAGLGLGGLGLLSLALGLIGLFQPLTAYGVTIALSLVSMPLAIRLFRRYGSWRPVNRPNLGTILYLLIIVLLTLPVALLPPTDFDGLLYHLTGPKLYLEAGRIVSGIDIPPLYFPCLMEMLYAWTILLRGDIAAKLLHAFFGLLLSGLVYLTAGRLLHQKSAWPATLIFASMPMINILAGWAHSDLALAFYQLASLYSIINYQSTINNYPLPKTQNQKPKIQNQNQKSKIQNPKSKIQNRYWLVLSGIFAGLAMGVKYTSFVTPVVVGGLILWSAYRPSRATLQASRFTGLADFATFSLVALLVALPWYVKNWAFTGNPVYPFLFGLFDGQYWDSFRADLYAAAGTGIGFRPGTLLALPWLATLGVRDVNYWDGRTGPLFLLFLPLVLLYGLFRYRRNAADRPAAIDPLLVYVLTQFGFWTLGVILSRSLWQSRQLLPGLVTLAPVAGWVWTDLSRFDQPKFSLRDFVNLVIGLTLVLTVVDVGLLTLKIKPLPYLAGLESRDEYLTRRLGAHYATMQQLNKDLPPEAVVIFLWEPRSYYCQRDCRPDSILDHFPHAVYQHGSAGAIAQAWRQVGVTHVLIHRRALNFVLRENPTAINTEILSALEQEHLQQVFDIAGNYQLYALGNKN